MKSSAWLPLAAALLTGCAITQEVRPVGKLESREVCLIENPAVSQPGFLIAYRQALADKGYSVKQLPPTATVNDCPITSRYTANWRWDLAMYMAFADIRVYREGQQVGQATYDSLKGGANMGKFIKGEEKIRELVNQLFPERAPTSST